MHRRLLLALAPVLLAGRARADGPPRAINHRAGVALDGWDAVAWFSEARPRRGDPAFRAAHAGVDWHFASAAHRARFLADPAAHLPRFGGFCAYGVARGYKVDIDPESWHIRDGLLYLNYDRGVQRQWQRDIPGHIARAEANWPRLAES
ncbi:YHS domain-containing (seleno)protein [Falsiroseomonas sp.]|uniref:YHS domain-containing (seleno)protein n=1 Tax=Falsiroseomonas sp. TaxID=2870721 RepID=UPI003F71C71B